MAGIAWCSAGMAVDGELARLVKRLREDGDKVVQFFESLEPGEWTAPVYREGSAWSAQDLLSHFVSAERSVGRLLEDVLQGGPGAPANFDIDGFNAAEVDALRPLSPAARLQAFRDARQQTLERVAGLDAADLRRRGRHPWLGDTTIEDIVQMIYRHTMIHVRDARKALESGPAPRGAQGRADSGEGEVRP
jgi:uncharacterized protein (TIGR03083 family)